MKDIVIIANFCRDFSETDNGRFMYLCKELAGNNRVEIVTSDFNHGTKRHKEPLVHTWPFEITFLHEPGYRKNISIQRFFSHRAWGREVEKYLLRRAKPDVVYCAVPSLTAPLAAARYCEKNGVRFIIDIQDLWPEAFQMVLRVPVLSDILFFPFHTVANGIYRRADAICAVSQTYLDRALKANKSTSESHVVYLGTNLDTFDENVRNHPVDKPRGALWLGYCGTLGASYDIKTVIDALAILKARGVVPPRFMVFGDGERREEFEAHARESAVDCMFTGQMPYPEMCGWLAACDIVVNPIIGFSAASIINKHGDYAATGLPVINTQNSEEYRRLIEAYHMGLNCKCADAADLADKLLCLIQDEDLRTEMGRNARRCAEERFDRKSSYRELTDCICAQ